MRATVGSGTNSIAHYPFLNDLKPGRLKKPLSPFIECFARLLLHDKDRDSAL